jgi:hypothetical protein
MSLIALPMPTVFASFPNIALSFIKMAMFFLQQGSVMHDEGAKESRFRRTWAIRYLRW